MYNFSMQTYKVFGFIVHSIKVFIHFEYIYFQNRPINNCEDTKPRSYHVRDLVDNFGQDKMFTPSFGSVSINLNVRSLKLLLGRLLKNS